MRRRVEIAALAAMVACTAGPPGETVAPAQDGPPPDAVAVFQGGAVTRTELLQEGNELPPVLRDRFATSMGKRELAAAMMDKRLLVLEARKRGFDRDPEVVRQVRELEERLMVQTLISAEEKTAQHGSEEEARAWYDANKRDLALPERVRIARILVSVPRDASAASRREARREASRLRGELRKGASFTALSARGDGPERIQNGDMGLIARGDLKDRKLEEAAFALGQADELSEVVECREGFAVLKLLERKPARVPSFTEVRTEVEARMAPQRKRRVFDDLLERLRESYGAHVKASALE